MDDQLATLTAEREREERVYVLIEIQFVEEVVKWWLQLIDILYKALIVFLVL